MLLTFFGGEISTTIAVFVIYIKCSTVSVNRLLLGSDTINSMLPTNTLKLGHLTIDPNQLGEYAPLWTSTSGLLVAQAMAPAAALEQSQIAKLNLLTCGSGSTLAAFLAVQMKCNHVDVILHPDEKQQLEEVLNKITSPTTINIISSPEQISGKHKYLAEIYSEFLFESFLK